MEKEKFTEKIKFLTGFDMIDEKIEEAWLDTMESCVKDNDPTGELLEAFCN